MASKNTVVEPCPICIEPYTKAIRKEIKCQYCQESVCSKCVEKYLTTTIDDPHCPHCRRAWSRAVLSTVCTKTFLNGGYFKYRQDILLNREKSYMPQLQELASREKRARDLEKDDLELAKEYGRIVGEYNAKLAKVSAARGALYRRISNIRAGRDEMTGARTDGGTDVKEEKAKFVRRCTANECKGFLSSVWKCGLCSVWVCPDCFEVKGMDKDTAHTCKPEMLETAKLIRKDTKPCPACGEMIMKTEGCDQMFCTSCHQAFSWNTGKIVTSGPIHNPHYFQWLARGGQPVPQNPGNVPCGGLPDAYYLRRCLVNAKVSQPEMDRFIKIYRECAHFIDVERHRYERHLAPNNNQDIGVKYMMNEMSEDIWKQTLAKREKDRQKSNEIRDILDAFNGAAIDLFRRIDTQRAYSHEQIIPILIGMVEELEALRVFTMEALRDVSKSFSCSVPMINHEWKTVHGKYTLLFPAKKREKKDDKKKDAKAEKPANAGAGKAPESDSDDSDSDSDDE